MVSGNRIGLTVFLLLAAAISCGVAQESENASFRREMETLRKAYPDVLFSPSYNPEMKDFEIIVERDDEVSTLYRAGGRYLSGEQLGSQEKYWSLLYPLPDTLKDPADLSDEEIKRIMRFGSTENRRSGRIAGTALFDALYDCQTREDVEKQIKSMDFLDRTIHVHRRIVGPLERVDRKIRSAALKDPSVESFLRELGKVSAYSWRSVRDSAGKSFHSMGLAVDIMPADLNGKAIYWNWEKSKGNDEWMLIPLSERWCPPEDVIRIFESEGFFWGGLWPIWDNMHFEYRPELLVWRDRK